MRSRAVVDLDNFDHPAANSEQRRQKTMHVIEERQREECVTRKDLESATRVAHAIFKQPAPNGIGDAGR